MWRRIGKVSGALLLFGVGPIVLATVGGCGRHHGSRDPAQVAAMVTNHVEDTLDDLKATPDQRTRILAVKDRMLAAAQAAHGDRKATRDAVLAAWKSDTPDAASLHALVDQRADELRKLAHQAVDAGVEVHGILTPDQRAQVTRKIERWHR
jgi:Spy/CpxP family protein refolding chaperone